MEQDTNGITQGHRWRFEATFNLGHIIMLVGLLGGGLSVYVGVFQTLAALVIRVDKLEGTASDIKVAHDLSVENNVSISELKALTTSIRDSNAKMLEQLTNIRVDVGVLKNSAGVEVRPRTTQGSP